MLKSKIWMKALLLLSFMSAAPAMADDLQTVEYVDKAKYEGKWITAKSIKLFFNRRCVGQTAEYEAKDNGDLAVLNTCIERDGDVKEQQGTARVVDTQTNAILEVTFDRWYSRIFNIKGDYRVIALDQDEDSDIYSHVMIGSNDRRSLWLMSRDGTFSDELLDEYLDIAEAQGFDLSDLED